MVSSVNNLDTNIFCHVLHCIEFGSNEYARYMLNSFQKKLNIGSFAHSRHAEVSAYSQSLYILYQRRYHELTQGQLICISSNHEDLNLYLQKPHKCWLSVVGVCISHIQRAETGSLKEDGEWTSLSARSEFKRKTWT